MTHDEVFLRDVIAHPDDDAPRLICADWLQDHGDPARAEFIRTQIERANASTDAIRRATLGERERQLLGEHELRWTAPLHGLVQRARFVRGFVEQVFVLGDDSCAMPRRSSSLPPFAIWCSRDHRRVRRNCWQFPGCGLCPLRVAGRRLAWTPRK